MKRAFRIGAILGGVALLAGSILLSVALNAANQVPEAPDRLLVIGLGPDGEGVEVAAFAFVLDRGASAPEALDVVTTMTVPGTTAESIREAYPFVGEGGVSNLLKEQTGGSPLPWLALPSSVWTEMVNDTGGLDVVVEKEMSVYRTGELVLLEKGLQHLDGAQALALSSAVDFMGEGARALELERLTVAVAKAVSEQRDRLPTLLADGEASSSLPPAAIKAFAAPR